MMLDVPVAPELLPIFGMGVQHDKRWLQAFKSPWVLAPCIVLGTFGVPFILRLFNPAGVEETSPALLWGVYGLVTFAALVCLLFGVAKYRKGGPPRAE